MNVSLYSKRDFADVIKELDVKIFFFLTNHIDPKCNHKEIKKRVRTRGDMRTEVEVRERVWKMLCHGTWDAEGATSQGMLRASRSLRSQGGSVFPGASSRNADLLITLIDFRISALQDCKIIDLFSFKPLSLW